MSFDINRPFLFNFLIFWKCLFFTHGPFGGLQRIDFYLGGSDFRFNMGGKITDSQLPFCFGADVGFTYFPGLNLDNSLAALAFFNNGIKYSAGVYLILRCSHADSPNKLYAVEAMIVN